MTFPNSSVFNGNSIYLNGKIQWKIIIDKKNEEIIAQK